MDDFENPYQSPNSDELTLAAIGSDADGNVDPRRRGKAKSVPTVAALMIVHGVFMFVAGILVIGMMVIMTPQMAEQMENQQGIQRQQNPNGVQFTKETWMTILYGTYGAMSACLFFIGALGIIAGVRNYGYRNRILGIISLIFNMGSILFCWCLPLSLGLLIYGLVIYLSPEADLAFRWRSSHPQQT